MKPINFQLCLGWVVVIGIPLIVLSVIIVSVLGDGISLSLLGKLFWTPFLFVWGLYQVSKFRAIKKSFKDGQDAETRQG